MKRNEFEKTFNLEEIIESEGKKNKNESKINAAREYIKDLFAALFHAICQFNRLSAGL